MKLSLDCNNDIELLAAANNDTRLLVTFDDQEHRVGQVRITHRDLKPLGDLAMNNIIRRVAEFDSVREDAYEVAGGMVVTADTLIDGEPQELKAELTEGTTMLIYEQSLQAPASSGGGTW